MSFTLSTEIQSKVNTAFSTVLNDALERTIQLLSQQYNFDPVEASEKIKMLFLEPVEKKVKASKKLVEEGGSDVDAVKPKAKRAPKKKPSQTPLDVNEIVSDPDNEIVSDPDAVKPKSKRAPKKKPSQEDEVPVSTEPVSDETKPDETKPKAKRAPKKKNDTEVVSDADPVKPKAKRLPPKKNDETTTDPVVSDEVSDDSNKVSDDSNQV
jgi:hypothetical protein